MLCDKNGLNYRISQEYYGKQTMVAAILPTCLNKNRKTR